MSTSARCHFARLDCLICGGWDLHPLMSLSVDGLPHGTEGHNFGYAYHSLAICGECGHAQLESYSHDCYPHYQDEDWEMYWWYLLSPEDVERLRSLLAGCPDRLDAHCGCLLHGGLRESSARLWGGVRHRVSPQGKADFAWIALDESQAQVRLKIDESKGVGMPD